jgi:hypothetical protein
MKFITNLLQNKQNKMIFYLAFILLLIFISYNLINNYRFTQLKNSNGTPFGSSTKLPVTNLNDAPRERPILNLRGYKMCKGITYKEGNTQNNQSTCNTMNNETCLSNAGICNWNSKLYQCSNKHNCYDINNENNCKQQKNCMWDNTKNTCNIK